MSPYSRYRPLPGSDGLSVLTTPQGCRQTAPSACRFLRWISKLSPQAVNKQTIGKDFFLDDRLNFVLIRFYLFFAKFSMKLRKTNCFFRTHANTI